MLDAVALLVQFLQRRLHAGAAEIGEGYALYDLVPAVAADARIAIEHAFRYAVAAVGRDAHADPVAVGRSEDPVAHVVDRRIGRAGRRGQAARVDDRRPALL